LFYAVRSGDPTLYTYFSTGSAITTAGGPSSTDFFKARGEQNYLGQTLEHVLCLTRQNFEIVDAIKPRPDVKDYVGNLPIFYSLQRNDVEMVQRLFKKGRDYFNIRNYKNQSIFHVAAKHRALEAL